MLQQQWVADAFAALQVGALGRACIRRSGARARGFGVCRPCACGVQTFGSALTPPITLLASLLPRTSSPFPHLTAFGSGPGPFPLSSPPPTPGRH